MSVLHKATNGLPALYHRSSVRLGRHAVLSRRKGLVLFARVEFWIAFRIEMQARRIAVVSGMSSEVLTRSAAILAFHAGARSEAARLAEEGLCSWMPDEIAAALREIIRRAEDPAESRQAGGTLPGESHDVSGMPVAAL